jgi:Domain of unknown function (DUF4282)
MEANGFFAALFDYSFSSFVTPRLIKILYVLATILISLWTLFLVLAGFKGSSGLGVVMLVIVAPLFFVISMIWARVVLELVIVFFRINTNVQDIHDGHGGSAAQPAPAPEAHSEPADPGAPTPVPDESSHAPSVATAAVEDDTRAEATPSHPSPPPPEVVPVRYCENCGAERSSSGRFCTSCGYA